MSQWRVLPRLVIFIHLQIKVEYDKEAKKNQREYLKVRAKRDKLGEKIDDSLLEKYNSLKDSHNVAIIMCEDERCGGCNMRLAALVIQRLKEKQRIIECENCGRILYLGKN
jgi:predicted  nucleic acid-binding Zn-ribbon protein